MNNKYIYIAIIIVLIIAVAAYWYYYHYKPGKDEGTTIAAPAVPETTGTAGSDIATEKDGVVDHKIYPKFLKLSLDNSKGDKGDFILNLMEVYVYDVHGNNIAKGAPVTTSGNYDNTRFPSSYLVDGNEDTMASTAYDSIMTAAGEKNGILKTGVQWMNITLPGTTDIKSVTIVNRPNSGGNDWMGKRFLGTNIQLLAKDNSPMKAWTISENKPRYELTV